MIEKLKLVGADVVKYDKKVLIKFNKDSFILLSEHGISFKGYEDSGTYCLNADEFKRHIFVYEGIGNHSIFKIRFSKNEKTYIFKFQMENGNKLFEKEGFGMSKNIFFTLFYAEIHDFINNTIKSLQESNIVNFK